MSKSNVICQSVRSRNGPREATEIDPSDGNIDLRVLSYNRDFGDLAWLLLFDSRPSAQEKEILAGDYLINRGPIERMVLLDLYPPVRAARNALFDAKTRSAATLVETRNVQTDAERRMLAKALHVMANLSAFRGDNLAALNGYVDIIKLLQPLVFDPARKPIYKDADLLFQAALQPVSYFTEVKKFDRAKDYLGNLSLISDRMIQSNPDEPDYLRWRAQAFLQTALIARGNNAIEEAVAALGSYVDTEREVHRRVGTPVTRQDLVDALKQGIELFTAMRPGSVPAAWRDEMQSLTEEMRR